MTTKEPCPSCRRKGRDNSGDNFTNYGEGNGGYCYSCGYTVLSDAEKEKRGLNVYEYDESITMTKEIITAEELQDIKQKTGANGKKSRGISDSTYGEYRVRFLYDNETGEVVETFYPYTEGFKACGYKVRKIPKDFYSVGKIGKESELFGQWKWKHGGGKYVLLTAGEADCLAAYEMLEAYRNSRNSTFNPIPCVSSGIGESGSWKQVQQHYEWFDTFEKIIVCYDMDDAGKQAVDKLSQVIPKGKMFVVTLPLKDINKMLDEGKSTAFIQCFYNAKPYAPTGVVGSSALYDAIIKEAQVEKLSFPSFMPRLNDMTAGGISLGTIGVISASTGLGKSSIVNECVYHWIFNSPHKIGVVSMEQNQGQYGELMLSRHIHRKLGKLPPGQKLEMILSAKVVEAQKELFLDANGGDRWMIVDDRDGDVESLKSAIEKLIIKCDCKVIVIDTISDMFDGLTTDEQAVLMKWQKSIVNRYNVAIINISHQRKAGSGEKDGSQGAMGNESSLHGTSTLIKSAAWILMLARNKVSDDLIERNTTHMMLPKNRGAGETGPAGDLYYDSNTHTLHDLDTWLSGSSSKNISSSTT